MPKTVRMYQIRCNMTHLSELILSLCRHGVPVDELEQFVHVLVEHAAHTHHFGSAHVHAHFPANFDLFAPQVIQRFVVIRR